MEHISYLCCKHCEYRPKGTPTGAEKACIDGPSRDNHLQPCATCQVSDV